MHISLNWLKDFVDIPKDLDPKDLADQLTLKTAEVEAVHDQKKGFENMVVGHVIDIKPHPNADKLKITCVNIGTKKDLQIVCGGTNLKKGLYVAVTLKGALVRWHGEGDPVSVTHTKIRDVESEGMIAAANEIGIPELQKGEKEILDLSHLKPSPGTPLADIFQLNDIVLEFDNKALTHRPDLWGHYGIAREVAAITKTKLKPINPNPKIPAKGESIKVTIEDFKLCPRYCGLIINNIKVEESPDWLKKRLKAAGHGTHNNIVDVTNYVVAELGQPMHAFDKNYIKGGIVVRRAKAKEKIATLDDKERTLDSNVLVIADHEKPVAIAGVIGGANSEINEKTTSIILESANFNASSIRQTSTKFNLRTDAVQRFEKAIDPNLAEVAIKRAAELILKICPGAKIAGPITDIRDEAQRSLLSPYPITIPLDTEKARIKIGADISDKEMQNALESLEFKIAKKGKIWEVQIPSFRATKDIDIEDDLIEEIARIYGYENIPTTVPHLPTRVPEENIERFKKHRARELLSYGLGFDEVYNYSFYAESDYKKCLLQEEGHLKLLNYLSADQTHLRISLVPNLLKNIQQNIRYEDEFKIYEIGHTYKEIGKYMPLEEKKITGAIVKKGQTDEPFYKAKGVVENFFQRFGIPKTRIARGITGTPYAHPNKSLSYLDAHGQTLAKVFMLHPKVAKNHDLEKYSIGFFAFNFTELMKLENEPKQYKQIPRFPSIEIDISVLVDKTAEIQTLHDAIQKADESLIAGVKLFDIYEGDQIESNKKAAAFKITLMAIDRTLTDEEMTQVQQKIFTNLETLGGKIRGKNYA